MDERQRGWMGRIPTRARRTDGRRDGQAHGIPVQKNPFEMATAVMLRLLATSGSPHQDDLRRQDHSAAPLPALRDLGGEEKTKVKEIKLGGGQPTRGAGPVCAWLGPVRNVRDEMRWKKEQEKKPNEKNNHKWKSRSCSGGWWAG